MRCKTCRKRMKRTETSLKITVCGEEKDAVRVPAYRCPVCGNIIVHDIIMERLMRYAMRKEGKIVDYAECENEETVAGQVL